MSIFEEMMGRHQREEVIKSKPQATEYLEDFLAIADLPEVGDYVERNKFGERKYNKPTGNQVAKVVSVFDELKYNKDGHVVNGTIAVVCTDGDIVTFGVDLRCYQTVKAQRGKNIFQLIRGK